MILLLTSLLGERLPASAFPEAIPLTVLASSVGPLGREAPAESGAWLWLRL